MNSDSLPKKPCVAHVSTVHPPFDQRIFHRECVSLAASGYETHLLVQYSQPMKQVDGVSLHSLGSETAPSLTLRFWQRALRSWRALMLAMRLKASIYHLHDPELIPLGFIIKALTRKRVIFDSHENNVAYVFQKTYTQGLLRKPLVIAMRALEKIASRFFDAIVTADQGVADLYLEEYRAKQVQVIYNFPRLELFPYCEASEAIQPFDLVYHGTIPKHHLEVIFEVADILRNRGINARWLLFGSCQQLPWAQSVLSRRGLADLFVIKNERVPHEKVAGYVQQAKIGIIPLPDLPKFHHNIPTKLFEYMALGMPVVLSDLPPSRSFVGDGKCAIMVPPDDYAAYADAIDRLLHDPAQRREMGRVGRQRVEEIYNWNSESRKLLALYGDLLDGSH